MSVVIAMGNECMERKYVELCRAHGCKCKVSGQASSLTQILKKHVA